MIGAKFASSRTARSLSLALATVSAALLVMTDHADARRHHRPSHRHHSHTSGGSYDPPFSSIIVDANSGATLQASAADGLRHPASLTKIMTLYMLFEQLESGKLRLDSALNVSEHASEQAPTKLGLRPGQTIRVEDAIKGIVTRSANDAAVVVAEAIGGSEDNFAKLMTRKARALGMTRTTYVNASGLPDDGQISTARDQSILGRAIQDRFPRYYRYFSTEVFNYHGSAIRNHNHLLSQMEGIDGIKTGYVRASGFNIVTSLRRGNRHLIGVVMGGRSAGSRDATMRSLLTEHLAEAATTRTVAAITERRTSDTRLADAGDDEDGDARTPARATTAAASVPMPAPAPIQTASAEPAATPLPAPRIANVVAAPAPAVTAQPNAPQQNPAPLTSGVISSQLAAIPGSSEPMKPTPVKTVQVRLAQPKAAAAPRMVAPAPSTTSSLPVRVADAGGNTVPAAVQAAPAAQASAAARPSFPAPLPVVITRNTPGLGEGMVGPAPGATSQPAMAYADPGRGAPPTTLGAQAAALENARPQIVASAAPAEPAPARVRGGWIIQVGALESESEAKRRLEAARDSANRYLGTASPFTEVFSKGRKTFYRARFAGLNQDSAEAACRMLKRSDISCMVMRD